MVQSSRLNQSLNDAEQQAIVAKVGRLLAVVEALAGQNLAAQAQAGQLMQAVLKEAFRGNGGG